jgi:hypothetical protein
MESPTIERVKRVLLLLTWMEQMYIAQTIDQPWQPHRAWAGLSSVQLTVLFIAFVLQQREHRLSYFDDWLQQHQHVVPATTGWTLGPKESTDDRFGLLLLYVGTIDHEGGRSRFPLPAADDRRRACPVAPVYFSATEAHPAAAPVHLQARPDPTARVAACGSPPLEQHSPVL